MLTAKNKGAGQSATLHGCFMFYLSYMRGAHLTVFKAYATSSPKSTIAHLRAIINLQGLLICSRAANSIVSGPI